MSRKDRSRGTSALRLAWKSSSLPMVWGWEGPGVAEGEAQTDEPAPQRVIGMLGPIAPGRAVVGDDLARQPEALEGFVQMTAHSLRSLVGAGRQAEREAGVIVEHGQRMAASGRYGEVALVVHLPQIV